MKTTVSRILIMISAGILTLGSPPLIQATTTDANDPRRILNLLSDDERAYLENKEASATKLSEEDKAHVARVIRLYEIELERAAEEKTEDAQQAAAQRNREQQYLTGTLLDEMANLRDEISRLKTKLGELQTPGETVNEAAGAERRYYLPIR